MNTKPRLLIFYPSNKRSVVLETICQLYSTNGINISVLTISEKGDFHTELDKMNIRNFSMNRNHKGISGLIKNIFYLTRFCNRNKIDIIHSHLQDANIISVFSQFLIRSKVIIFRHHFFTDLDSKIKRNKNEIFGEKIINLLAKKIIVPSKSNYYFISKNEKVNPEKIDIIPYIYDFRRYPAPNFPHVDELRNRYPSKLTLLMCSRHTKEKRHILAFDVVKELVNMGLDIMLIVLDDGPERINLENYVISNNLENRIIFMGFRKDFIDFMTFSELLIHPSISEASNNSVKEMGMLKKGVAVCKGVGDFDDYIQDGKNGFIIDHGNPHESLKKIIIYSFHNKNSLESMGEQLKISIENRFGLNESLIKKYLEYAS